AGAAVCFTGVRPTPARATSSGTAAAEPATPIWSARRVPALLVEAAQSAATARAGLVLTQRLSTIVAPYSACVAVRGSTGPIASVGGSVALAPASTFKLLTATTAIARLGPEHRFTTRVL